MSKIFVDQVDPKTGTSLTLGTSGDTVNIPSGVTLANAGTVTGLPASAISSGTIATARLGSGTASSSTFLRGDQTYAAAAGNYVNLANAQSTVDVAEIAINGVFDHSLYKFYKLFLYVLPSATNNTLQMQVRDSSNNNVTGNKYKSIAAGKTIYGSGQGDVAFDRWDGTYWMIAQNQKGAAPDGAFIDMTLRPYFSADSPSAGTWVNWSVGYTRHTDELWTQVNGTGNEDSTTNLSGGGMRFYYGAGNVSEYQYNVYGVKYA